MTSNCSACGGKVSIEASLCPHCGHPLKYEWKPVSGFFAVINTLIGIGLFLFMIVLLFTAIFN